MTQSGLPALANLEERNNLFNRYLAREINFTPNDFDSVITYFLKRGFDEVGAINTSVILLQQADKDNLNVQQLIDTLAGLTNVQLSKLVATILNVNRSKSSKIGYRIPGNPDLFDERNIVA